MVDISVIGASLHPVVHTQAIITSPVTTVITIPSTTIEVDQLTIAVADLPVRKLSPTPSPGSSKRACLSKDCESESLTIFWLLVILPSRLLNTQEKCSAAVATKDLSFCFQFFLYSYFVSVRICWAFAPQFVKYLFLSLPLHTCVFGFILFPL